MAQPNLSFENFNRRLILAGGRNQVPEGGMRRCVGAARELTTSLRSRYGSTKLYDINALNLYRFNNHRYQFDGANLYRDGVVIDSGYNGNRGTFTKMPPEIGLPDYLFCTGAGKSVKIDPDGNVSKWGIDAPPNGFTGAAGARKTRVIDTFNGSSAGYTLGLGPLGGAKKADDTTLDGNDLKLSFAGAAHWYLRKALAIDLSTYADTTPSLQTDAIALTVEHGGTGLVEFGLQIAFSVGAANFSDNEYFVAVVSFIANPQFAFDWSQIASLSELLTIRVPKSVFRRVGSNGVGWEGITAVQLSKVAQSLSAADYGNRVGSLDRFGAYLLLQNWQLEGGYALGAGASPVDYRYQVTYLNLTTGSRSNPNPTPVRVSSVLRQPVTLTHLPISADAQVGAREIWRTTGGDADPFFVAMIPDNATTIFIDTFADFSGIAYTVNPWTAGHVYVLNTLIDGLNGFYFKVTTAGTSAGAVPSWNVPSTTWAALAGGYSVGDTIVSQNNNAPRNEFRVTSIAVANPKTGAVEPNWGAVAVGASVTDGGVVWLNLGPLTTSDNTVVWTFQGINAVPALSAASDGIAEVPLDNDPPLATYEDGVGPFQGTMFWTRDTTPGARGRVYFSPAGRAEAVLGFIDVSNDDDPAQKLAIWNDSLWLLSQKYVWRLQPVLSGNTIIGWSGGDGPFAQRGTTLPFTVASRDEGISYQSEDGPRLLNWNGSQLVGFDQISPVLRGGSEENVAAFVPTFAARAYNEVMMSDGTVMFALQYDAEAGLWTWRMVRLPFTAMYQEIDTKQIVASWGGKTYLYETEGVFTDDGTAIEVEWQTASVLRPSIRGVTKRFYFDIDLQGEVVTPTVLIDNTDYPLPSITNNGRTIHEIAFQRAGKLVGLRLNGTVSHRVELFAIFDEDFFTDENTRAAKNLVERLTLGNAS